MIYGQPVTALWLQEGTAPQLIQTKPLPALTHGAFNAKPRRKLQENCFFRKPPTIAAVRKSEQFQVRSAAQRKPRSLGLGLGPALAV